MKCRVCLSTATIAMVAACVEPPSERTLVASDAFPFTGPAPAYAGMATDEAELLARTSLLAGEQLSWFGPIGLNGIGATYVMAAALGADGISRGYAVAPDGSSIEQSELVLREERRLYERFGKLRPTLYSEIQDLSDDEHVTVSVFFDGSWASFDPFEVNTSGVGTDLVEYVEYHRGQQRLRIDEARRPLLKFLTDNGAAEVLPLPALPAVVVDVPVALLRSRALHERADVVSIGSQVHESPELLGYAGQGSMFESSITGGGCGTDCDGDGGLIEVGLWERTDENNGIGGTSHATIAHGNTRYWTGMGVQTHQPVNTCSTHLDCGTGTQRCVSGKCRGEHVSHVAASIGMIGSYTYPQPGTDDTPNAPGTVTFSTSGPYSFNVALANKTSGSAELDNVNWLLDDHQGLFINRSMDSLSDDGADGLNWAARYNGTFYTMAGGNDKNSVTDCERVWNGICVGWYGYNTYNNPSTHVRFVTGGSQGSSYKNPTSNLLFERPHLLGPGGHSSSGASGLHMPSVTSTGSAMTFKYLDLSSNIFGSSFSAPAVLGAGMTALEYSGWFSTVSYPVVNKAVILAGTIDSNADGQIGNGNVWTHSSSVDYEDGAGHVDYRLVKAIIDNNRFHTANLVNGSFASCGTGCREYTVATVTVPANKRIRVALAWNACSARTSTAFINNDLDLYLIPPAVCGVPSYVSDTGLTSEIEMLHSPCALQPASTQWTIKVRIKNGANLNSCGSDTHERIGVAWSI